MNCPICNKDTKVNDSRLSSDGISIRRRRECLDCSFRFSTIEEMEIMDLTVIKRDGRKEAYARDKLERGLKIALEKRPVTADNFKKLIHNIEWDIQKKKKNEIKSIDIGEIAMKRLRKFDKVAYIRFASVYHTFEDVRTFQKELAQLLKKGKVSKNKPKKKMKI